VNWDAIGAVGEIIGAFAVLATLAYLALQVRQNTMQMRATSHHAISDSLNHINILFAENSEVSEIWLKGCDDRSSLTHEQKWRFDATLRAYFHVCETMYFQAEVGTGDQAIKLAEERGMVMILATPGGREWWVENPYGFTVEFREYVERTETSRHPVD
jgi:hypothetical protein